MGAEQLKKYPGGHLLIILVRVERERLARLGFPVGRRLGNRNASISVSLGSYHGRTTFASLNKKHKKYDHKGRLFMLGAG